MPVANGVAWGGDFIGRITKEKFRVHSVFGKVCNLQGDALPLLSLVNDEEAMGPNALLVKGICFKEILAQDKAVGFKSGFLSCGLLKIDCRETSLWQPATASLDSFQRSIDSFQRALEWLQIWVEMQYPGLISVRSEPAQQLQQALLERDQRLLAEALQAFIGVGPGLTPTGDDFVGGVLAAYVRGQQLSGVSSKLTDLLPGMLAQVGHRTNAVSRTMLYYASRGAGALYLTSMIDEIYGNGPRVFEHAVSLLQVGSSSGRYLLAGILLGCEICLRELSVDGTKDSS